MDRSLPRGLPSALVAFLLIAALAPGTSALERTSGRIGSLDRPDEWAAGTTCSVAYYNICSGYIWIWSGLQHDEMFGTVFESCCAAASLDGSYFYYRTGAPPARGVTGTVAVHAVDENDCLVEPALSWQPILPAAGWNYSTWGVSVPPRFAIVHRVSDEYGLGTPVTIATDGRYACGVCYSSQRPTRSSRYGFASSPLCPPDPMFDGACFVEFLAAALMTCPSSSGDDASWGRVKELYR